MEDMLLAISYVTSWNVVIASIIGVTAGVTLASIPGLTATLGMAIILPFTFHLDLITSIVLLSGLYTGGAFGGSISAILINIPGSPAATATTIDGYPMTVKGRQNEALGIALASSSIGGFISYLVIFIIMSPLANLVLKFGPPEMLLVGLFALTIIASLKGEGLLKGLIAGGLGLLAGNLGMSPTGTLRALFGMIYLYDGVPTIPALIGLLAIPELLRLIKKEYITESKVPKGRNLKKIIWGIKYVFKRPYVLACSIFVGTLIGAVPAAGGTIASLLSHDVTRKLSKNPDSFSQGNPDGVIAAEAANNSAEGGAMATTLAFGIPGSAAAAVLIAAFMLQGLIPGPRLVSEQLHIIYALIYANFFQMFAVFIIGLLYIYFAAEIVKTPTKILAPLVFIAAVVGTFSLRNAIFDVELMFFFGLLGWVLKSTGYPVICVVLGLILAPLIEGELIRVVQRFEGEYLELLVRPYSIGIIIVGALLIFLPKALKKLQVNK